MCLVVLKWLGIVHGRYKRQVLLAIFAPGAPTVGCIVAYRVSHQLSDT